MFESDQPNDYIGGFPHHPHRGFETVTYLLAGRMRHKDNAGHEGVIEPGGVQWMTAGRGIIHSEMPEQKNGLLQGFQLWINLPAVKKMTAPRYQEYHAFEIPIETHTSGSTIRVISGRTDRGTEGLVKNEHTNPLFLDVNLINGKSFQQDVSRKHGVFVYVIKGSVHIGVGKAELSQGMLGVLGAGDKVIISSKGYDSRFLLIRGKRLNEPVARGGPFVMNTSQEVQQAFKDFQQGRV